MVDSLLSLQHLIMVAPSWKCSSSRYDDDQMYNISLHISKTYLGALIPVSSVVFQAPFWPIHFSHFRALLNKATIKWLYRWNERKGNCIVGPQKETEHLQVVFNTSNMSNSGKFQDCSLEKNSYTFFCLRNIFMFLLLWWHLYCVSPSTSKKKYW